MMRARAREFFFFPPSTPFIWISFRVAEEWEPSDFSFFPRREDLGEAGPYEEHQ